MSDDPDLFPAEALAENSGGHLTIEQKARLQRMVSGRRTSTRGVAVPFAAIGVLLLVLSGPAATASRRHLGGWAFLAVATMIVAAPAFDPLAADVREGRVETVQGAIGKRRVQSGRSTQPARYYLTIGGRQLRTFRSAYEQAPDAGYVRAFYLPRTRRLVNLERLANPPLPANPDEARDMFGSIARAFVSGDRAALAEARANAAGFFDAAQETFGREPDTPSGAVAGGLARETILGTWKHALLTVTFAENGTATVTTIMGATQTGHWSIDAHGRLLTDVTGTMAATDAAVDAGRLTIQIEGRRLTFTRGAEA
jgi:hypothetical protein